MSDTMRAARLRSIDGQTRLVVDDAVPVPAPGPGEVRIDVHGCGLNQVDLLSRDGQTPQPIALPHIAGTEVSGRINALGQGVTDWQVGDEVVIDPILHCGQCPSCASGATHQCRSSRVFGVQTPGGYAEQTVAPARQLHRIPTGLSPIEAASIAVTAPTAWHMLKQRARLQAGETVLIIAAGSGIGVAAIQIARLLDARVLATAGSQAKLDQALALGAHEVINHSDPDWAEEVRKLTSNRGVDVVFEHVGRATWNSSLRSLGRGGRLVTCGGHSGFEVGLNLWHLFVKEQSLIGSFAATRQDFLEVMRVAGEGRLRPVIQQVFSLGRAPEAQALLEHRGVFGKLMIDPRLTG